MRYLVWLARLLVFVLVLMFALNNMAPVDVHFYGANVFAGLPLILVMLGAFVLGTVFGLLLAARAMFRRGREIKRLKRKLDRARDDARHRATAPAPQTPTPLAPL